MALTATVRARIDSELKKEVEEILKQIGMTTSQAINLFMNRIKIEKGIPFELKIPNDLTLKAMGEADDGIGETISYEDFIKESQEYVKTLQK